MVDLSALPAGARERAVRRLIAADTERPFDLVNGPVLRTAVLRNSGCDHIFVLNFHHLAMDVWSLWTVGSELSLAYNATCSGEPAVFQGEPVQPADYAVWQRKSLSGTYRDDLLRFWRNELAGAQALRLPVDHPRTDSPQFVKDTEWTIVGPESSEALRKLSRDEGATLFMTLLAVFQVLLRHWTGQQDITLATPTAGRVHPWLEGTVGFLVRDLWFRAVLSDNTTFCELLRQDRVKVLNAFDYQEVPFEDVVAEFAGSDSPLPHPLLQIGLMMLSMPKTSMRLAGLTIGGTSGGGGEKIQRIVNGSDLELHVYETDAEVQCGLVFDSSLFERSTIACLSERLKVLISRILADPAQRIGDLAPEACSTLPASTLPQPSPDGTD